MTLPDPPPPGTPSNAERELPTPAAGLPAPDPRAGSTMVSTPLPPPPPPRPPWLDDLDLTTAISAANSAANGGANGEADGEPPSTLLPSRPLGPIVANPPVNGGAPAFPPTGSAAAPSDTGRTSAFPPPSAERAIAPLADPTSVPPLGSPQPVSPVQGGPVQGGPVQGGPVQSGPQPVSQVQGGPVQGGPVQAGSLPVQHTEILAAQTATAPVSPSPTPTIAPSSPDADAAGAQPPRRRGSGRMTTVALAGTAPVVITAGLLAALSSGSTLARLISVAVSIVLTFVLIRVLIGPSAISILQVARWIGRAPGESSDPPPANPEATNEVAALLDAVAKLESFVTTGDVRPGTTSAATNRHSNAAPSPAHGLADASVAAAIRRSCLESHRELDVLFDQPTAPDALRSLINADHLVSVALHRATVDLVLRGDAPSERVRHSVEASSVEASSVEASSDAPPVRDDDAADSESSDELPGADAVGSPDEPSDAATSADSVTTTLVPLDDVMRRGVGAVSEFQRIDVGFIDPLGVHGDCVEQLALLLTEVLGQAMIALTDSQRITIGTDLVDDELYIVIAGLDAEIDVDSAPVAALARRLDINIENYTDGDEVTVELHVPDELLAALAEDDPITAAGLRREHGVRPTVMTGGRYAPSRPVPPTSMITVSSRREPVDDFRWEAAALMHAADRPRRLTELAEAASVPLTVAEIIVADLIESGSLIATERRTRSTARSQLEAALSG